MPLLPIPLHSTLGVTGHRSFTTFNSIGAAVHLAFTLFELYKPKLIITGMALGWDQYIANAAIQYKVPFIAACPFRAQPQNWTTDKVVDYYKLLEQAQEVIYTTDEITFPVGGHTRAYKDRNCWIVDNSKGLVAFWSGASGGTKHCLSYALQCKRPVVNVYPKWLAMQDSNSNRSI